MTESLWSARRLSVLLSSGQVGALALLAGLGAGCSADSMRLDEPVFTGSTPNQQQIITARTDASGAVAAPAMPAGAVMAQPLPTITGSGAVIAPAPTAGDAPRPYVPPAPWAAKDLPTPVGVVVPR